MLYTHQLILFHPQSYLERWEPLSVPFTDEEIRAQRSWLESVADPEMLTAQPELINLREYYLLLCRSNGFVSILLYQTVKKKVACATRLAMVFKLISLYNHI